MSVVEFEHVDETLRLIAEARERAEQGVRAITAVGGREHVVDALDRADRELTALYRSVLDATLFQVPDAGERQLVLDPAA